VISLIAKLDQLIVVRSMGIEATGIYYLSAEISRIATFSTILPIGRALHPGYVKLIDEPERLASAYLKVFAFIVTVAASIGFGLSAVSKDFIAVVLGSQSVTRPRVDNQFFGIRHSFARVPNFSP